MTTLKRTGGGRFDPSEKPIYFMAGNCQTSSTDRTEHTLVALNDLPSKQILAEFEQRIAEGKKVLLDSGVFWLTNQHKRAHGVTMDEALSLHPNEIDGFDSLRNAYVEVVKKYQDDLWGFIELDQGGAERKRETRAGLEAEGITPIPVYHPLNDGWDYFDELANEYDRICIGNVVQASGPMRARLLSTLWERHRNYPHLWIHVLGLTPNEDIGTYWFNSCDSSSTGAIVRWGGGVVHVFGMSALRAMSTRDYQYGPKTDGKRTDSYDTSVQMAHTTSSFITRAWRVQHDADEALCPALPPVEKWEEPLR